jgi:tetratricopeptide (TPR) repeat protein
LICCCVWEDGGTPAILLRFVFTKVGIEFGGVKHERRDVDAIYEIDTNRRNCGFNGGSGTMNTHHTPQFTPILACVQALGFPATPGRQPSSASLSSLPSRIIPASAIGSGSSHPISVTHTHPSSHTHLLSPHLSSMSEPSTTTDDEWKSQAAALKLAADTSFRAGDYQSAAASYSQAISIDDNNHVLYSNRSASLLKNGEVSKAMKDGEKCVELKPDWSKGYSRLGAAQYALGRYAVARETYKKGLLIEPANASLLEGVAAANKAEEAKAKAASEHAKQEAERLKQEEAAAANKKEEPEKDEADEMDDFFGEIADTVSETQTKLIPKKEISAQEKFTSQPLGSSASQIDRLESTNCEWKNLNPFYVLQIDVDANDEDIKTRYRKLSGIVHPDKNIGAEKATPAFEKVKKAYNSIQTVDQRKHFIGLIEAGRDRARKSAEANASEEDIVESEKKEVMLRRGNSARRRGKGLKKTRSKGS